MKPSLAVVICNYNKIEYLKGCLDSLWVSKKNWPAMKVFVVDNASQDGSQKMVQTDYADWVELIALDTNTGGAGGFSRGMQAAVASQCEYTALLDNDILLDDDTLQTLVSYLQTQPAVGVAGAKICTMDNPDVLQELGAFIDWENYNVSTPLKGHRDTLSLPATVVCDYVPACCMVTRTEIIRQVGTFDEAHFIYWDDMDWCTRVKRAGHEIHAISKARVRHKMGAVNTTNTFSNYYFERNRLRFFAKYLSQPKFEDLAKHRCHELAQQAFFSARKGVQAQAISAQLAILDFAAGRWFAQPEAILEKGQHSFKEYLPDTDAYRVHSHDNELLMRISAVLEDAGGPVVVGSDTEGEVIGRVLKLEVCEHILSAKSSSDAIIDRYLNACMVSDLPALKADYQCFERVFERVETPVFYRQMMTGYSKLRRETQ